MLYSTYQAVQRSKGNPVTYDDFIREARDLVAEDGSNPEYDRALYELGARLFGVADMPTDDRATFIEYDIDYARIDTFVTSKGDGSPAARLYAVGGNQSLFMNECGDKWTDPTNDWQPTDRRFW